MTQLGIGGLPTRTAAALRRWTEDYRRMSRGTAFLDATWRSSPEPASQSGSFSTKPSLMHSPIKFRWCSSVQTDVVRDSRTTSSSSSVSKTPDRSSVDT